MVEAVCRFNFIYLVKLMGVANFSKYAIMSKFVELKRRLFAGLTK